MSSAFDRLDGQIISGLEGMMKPGSEIFQRVCKRFGFASQEAFFVDDSAMNITAAKGLGFHAHHLTDPAELRPPLEAVGLF